MFLTEITALQMLEGEDSIIDFYEAFDYRERLFVFLEEMTGGNITSILDTMNEKKFNISYSEAFCKYTLYKTLKAIIKLHSKNIIHRNI